MSRSDRSQQLPSKKELADGGDPLQQPKVQVLITPAGYKKLADELSELLMRERPRIVDEVRAAAKQGDRSENAEYQYGKRRLREIDRRTRFLSKRLEACRIIEPAGQNPDRVRFGATVELLDEDGNKRTYQLVGEDETDVKKGRISWKSPVGQALLGKRRGDIIEVKAPGGDREYEVIGYSYI
jgi:transcription elongation factor GreB